MLLQKLFPEGYKEAILDNSLWDICCLLKAVIFVRLKQELTSPKNTKLYVVMKYFQAK